MRDFARVTKLNDIAGRGDYISNPNRQEDIVAQSAPIDWEPYHQYEQEHKRTYKANNEGREVVIQLPNEWAGLSPADLSGKAARLAMTATGKETDLQWAVHWNETRSNLHMHVIFSERQFTGTIKRYDRDVYLTAAGKVARRRADRMKLADGNEAPPIHMKGEVSSWGLSAKDKRYKARSWPRQVRQDLRAGLVRLGADLEPHRAAYELHQHHQGKGSASADIALKNWFIEDNNSRMRMCERKGISPKLLMALKNDCLRVLKDRKVPVVLLQKRTGKLYVEALSVSQAQAAREGVLEQTQQSPAARRADRHASHETRAAGAGVRRACSSPPVGPAPRRPPNGGDTGYRPIQSRRTCKKEPPLYRARQQNQRLRPQIGLVQEYRRAR